MVFFDIETRDFFDDPQIAVLSRPLQLQALRFGIAVTYDDAADEWREWMPDDLPALWAYLVNKDVCGWNIVAFDMAVIAYNLSRLHNYPAADLDPMGAIFDLFHDIRWDTNRWYKLDVIAERNLGRGKIAHGQQAAEWLRSDDPKLWRKAMVYCWDDVQLVVDLWRKLERGERLLLPPRPERNETVEIHWGYDWPLPQMIEKRRPKRNPTADSFRRGWEEAQAGQVHPVDTLWDGITDNDDSQ